MRVYLIWSIEHQAWWGPDHCGYTRDRAAAGHYTHDEANDILEDANVNGVNECLIPIACVGPAEDDR